MPHMSKHPKNPIEPDRVKRIIRELLDEGSTIIDILSTLTKEDWTSGWKASEAVANAEALLAEME